MAPISVAVVGRNFAGVWQDEADATLSRTWTVDRQLARVRISEVLARNATAVHHEGTYPDLVELVNDGGCGHRSVGHEPQRYAGRSDQVRLPVADGDPSGRISGPLRRQQCHDVGSAPRFCPECRRAVKGCFCSTPRLAAVR